MPSKWAKLEWEKQQEENLRYVAYTRAKNFLGFIDKKVFNAWDETDDESQSGNVSEVKESKWIGTVGQKSPLILTITLIKEIVSDWGETYLFEFIDKEGNLFSKFGKLNKRYIHSNHDCIDEGVTLAFDATVKSHKEFKSEKITELSTVSKYSETYDFSEEE